MPESYDVIIIGTGVRPGEAPSARMIRLGGISRDVVMSTEGTPRRDP
jgi:hypothetical protein